MALLAAAFILPLPQLTWARSLTIGSIHNEPAAEVKRFWPLARYLANQLQSAGIDQGRVVVAQSVLQMAAFLREGKVDLYLDSPFTAVAVSRLSGSKFLLRRWKMGVGEYHTVIFARMDSGISRLEDLKGKIIALEEPFSSTGYLLPKMVLGEQGLKLAPKQATTDVAEPDEVGYVFSYDDENTMVWVLRGKVLAGAIDNHHFLQQTKENLENLTVLYETFSIPRHIVGYRADLPDKLVERIKSILLQMHQQGEGRKVLQEFEKTAKFDEIPHHAMLPLLKSITFFDAEFGHQ
jgi:phosphonate transport system substrate-binding protein